MAAPRAVTLALVALTLGAAPEAAQSLAEIARKAEERRSETKAPAKTYTNGNLTPDFTVSASAPETAGELRRDPAAPEAPVAPEAPSAEPPDEAFWRRQAKAMNARLEEARKAMANVPNPATDTPGELQRVEEYVAKAKARLARAEEDYQVFLMQADVAKVPKAWIQ